MRLLRIAMMLLGAMMVAMGLLWIGQGLGIVQWPASSFMLDQRPWAAYGALLAGAGFFVSLLGRHAGR